MKIIKQVSVGDWTYNHHCINCESDLEVEISDLEHHRVDGDFRDPAYDSFIASCEVCDKSFVIPTNLVPKLVQINVIKRKGTLPY